MKSKKLNLNKIEISNLDSVKITEGTHNIIGGKYTDTVIVMPYISKDKRDCPDLSGSCCNNYCVPYSDIPACKTLNDCIKSFNGDCMIQVTDKIDSCPCVLTE